MKQMPRLVTAFALADDAGASDLASKARAKPVTAYAERYMEHKLRKISRMDPNNMKTPTKHLFTHLTAALINIAPENKDLFHQEHGALDIEFEDSHKWILNCAPDVQKITVSRKVVEVMWGAAYGYMTIYMKIVQSRLIDQVRVVDLHEDEEISKAAELLSWVFSTWLTSDGSSWPANLPQPTSRPKFGSMQNVADELCLCGCAVLMHHELAHIRLKHSPPTTIDMEKDADREAVRWIIDHDFDELDDRFVKRMLGVVLAFEVLTAKGIHTRQFGGSTHPFSYDRLYAAISENIESRNHVVWCFLAAIMKLHLDNSGVATESIVYGDFQESVDNYIDLLSEISNGQV